MSNYVCLDRVQMGAGTVQVEPQPAVRTLISKYETERLR